MGALAIVETWDAALRAGDWAAARAVLADEATYVGPGEDQTEEPTCTNADEILALMRSFKGTVPDVEVVGFDERAEHVIAHLRQPAWGPDAEWYQVLQVEADRITSLADFSSVEDARSAASVE